jgi:hypothetical protein
MHIHSNITQSKLVIKVAFQGYACQKQQVFVTGGSCSSSQKRHTLSKIFQMQT